MTVEKLMQLFEVDRRDALQMIEAEKFCKIYIENRKITKKKAKEILGEEDYWRAMHRAAFHWGAARETLDGKMIFFDCHDYFRHTN